MISTVMYQMASKIGDINHNKSKIIDHYLKHNNTDLIITPELALTGYSPEDLLFSTDFQNQIMQAISEITDVTKDFETTLIVGAPFYENEKIYNAAYIIYDGKIDNIIIKNKLPNYDVFRESRYFSTKKNKSNIIYVKNSPIGVLICEDMWHLNYIEESFNAVIPEAIISINASPFHSYKQEQRKKITEKVANMFPNTNIYYLNAVGQYNSLLFDGGSFILNKQNTDSTYIQKLASFKEDKLTSNANISGNILTYKNYSDANYIYKNMYNALMFALKNYVTTNAIKKVVVGLSGGLDSALVAIIAVDTLGLENVELVYLPSKYTSELSSEIVNNLTEKLQCNLKIHNIQNIVDLYLNELNDVSWNENNCEENIQARIRGNILMTTVNNIPRSILLGTSNKSEIATGYSTLYGDAIGGFSLIKDIYKTDIINLTKWRNNNLLEDCLIEQTNFIPDSVITRSPSAELKEDQQDKDSLPEYDVLDKILFELIEEYSPIKILYEKYNKIDVNKVVNLIKNSEHKRKQSPIGPTISTRSFTDNFFYSIT